MSEAASEAAAISRCKILCRRSGRGGTRAVLIHHQPHRRDQWKVRLENTASATINNDPAHCFVAIELSKSSWVWGFQTPLAKQTSRYQVKACDARALLELIERVRSRMARELGRPVEVMSCYEAGYDGF